MSHSDETRPLISELSADQSGQRKLQVNSLPKLQVATLLLSYFAETIIAVFSYPFLAQVRGGYGQRHTLILTVGS
jgi:hypothetical protein